MGYRMVPSVYVLGLDIWFWDRVFMGWMGGGGGGGSVVLEVSGLMEFSVREVEFSEAAEGCSGVTVGCNSGREDGLTGGLLSEGVWAGLCELGRGEYLESGRDEGLTGWLLSEGEWAGFCELGRGEHLESVRGLTGEVAVLCGPSEESCSSPTGGPRSEGVD